MMHSYKYTLCSWAVLATFDLTAANLATFNADHWLSSIDNGIVLMLKGKVFIDNPDVLILPVRVH